MPNDKKRSHSNFAEGKYFAALANGTASEGKANISANCDEVNRLVS